MTRFKYESELDRGDKKLFAEEMMWINHYAKQYAKLFELNKWTVRMVWSDRDETEKDGEHFRGDYDTTADCDCDPEYKSARVTFYLRTIDEKHDTWEEVNEMVRHEFLHIRLWKLAQVADDLVSKREKEVVGRVNEDITTELAELDFWERLVPTDPD